MDSDAVYALILSHHWVALAAVSIGAFVRLLKSDSPVPKWLHLPAWAYAPNARVWVAVGGGVLTGVLDRMAGGDTWGPAILSGLFACGAAIVGHETIVESIRGGREFFEPKAPSNGINGADGPAQHAGDPPGTAMKTLLSPDVRQRLLTHQQFHQAFLSVMLVTGLAWLTGCGWLTKNHVRDVADIVDCVIVNEQQPPALIVAKCGLENEAQVFDILSTHRAGCSRKELSMHTGYILDPEGHKVTSYRIMKGRLPLTAIPGAFSLEQWLPPVFDQGQTSSCTGHATSGALATTFAANGAPLPYVPSMKGIYHGGLAIDRVPENDSDPLPPFTDDGAAANQVLRGINEFGIRPMGKASPDGRFSDCDPKTINHEDDFGELEREIPVIGSYRVDSRGKAFVEDVVHAIVNGSGVTFATLVSKAVEDWTTKKGPIGRITKPDGWHYLFAFGYWTRPDGSRIIRFRNSWNATWGDRGNGEGDEAFMSGWRDTYVTRPGLLGRAA